MKIGEIVEILIRVKDDYGYSDFRKEAVEEACNLLDKLPAQEEATTYEPFKDRVLLSYAEYHYRMPVQM